MEDSTSYTLQEIEKLKLKISGYRNTLMTLKMGTSFEDFQLMKREFEALKFQLSFIEGLTKTLEEKQLSQNELYEEQVKQLTIQIASLNNTVEEMGQEILSISKKVANSKSGRSSINTQFNEENDVKKPTDKVKYIHNAITTNNDQPKLSSQPSYMQLRNLSKQIIQQQNEEENNNVSIEPIEYKANQTDQRYFNQRYFQSINTQPNNTYNGLNKNTPGTTPFHFKSSEKNDDAQPSDLEKITTSSVMNEPKQPMVDGDTINDSGNTFTEVLTELRNEDSTAVIINESSNDNMNIEQQNQFEPKNEVQMDEQEHLEKKRKKQWNSSFFDIFRK